MRIFAISDLHVDYSINAHWLSQLSFEEYQNDILIVAGDITDNIKLLESTFIQLKKKFRQIIYVPGNHELWVIRSPQENSIKKFKMIQETAKSSGIIITVYNEGFISIVPLLGWYDYSFGVPVGILKKQWTDFIACKWPEYFNEKRITEYFISQNIPLLEIQNKIIISFSHFLPRIDLMPKYIPRNYHIYYPVLGSYLLELQIRKLKPKIHIYGHSHCNQKILLDDIWYINNAFGYPKELYISRKELLCIFES